MNAHFLIEYILAALLLFAPFPIMAGIVFLHTEDWRDCQAIFIINIGVLVVILAGLALVIFRMK